MPPQSRNDTPAQSGKKTWIPKYETFISYPNDWTPNFKRGIDRSRWTAATSVRMDSESLNRWYGRSTMPAQYQWGYRAGMPGISYAAPTTDYVQNYVYDPNTGMVLPMTSDAAKAAEDGYTPTAAQLLGGTATGIDSNNRIDIPGIIDPNTGQIGSLDPIMTEKKFADAKAAATKALLDQRAASGVMAPMTPEERAALDQQAEQQAIADMSIYMGGNAANYPKSVAGPLAVPEFKAGQFFPGFDGANPRPITEDEARVFNFIRNSGAVPDPNSVLAGLFDPNVPQEEKRAVLAQAAGAYSEYAIKAPTAEDQWTDDGWYWSWNPIEMAGQVLMKGILEPLSVAYNDFIIPSYTWTASALPGGVRTASFEEARAIAPGQMTAAVLGPRAASLMAGSTMGFSQAGAVIEGITSGNWNNYRELSSGYYNALMNDQAPWKDLGDGIYDQAKREVLFEKDFYGSQVSGGIGLMVNVVWDPLWLAGPIGKGIRVSHMLGMAAKPLRSYNDAYSMVKALDHGMAVNRQYDLGAMGLDAARRAGNADAIRVGENVMATQEAARQAWLAKASPVERFVDWVVRPDAQGKRRTAAEIMEHGVIKFGSGDATRAVALSKAKSFEEAAIIVRAGLGDRNAIKYMQDFSAHTARQLEDLRIAGQIDNIASAPDKYMKVWALLERNLDNSIEELRRLEDEALYTIDPSMAGQTRGSLLQRQYDALDEAEARLANAADPDEIARAQVGVDAARTRIGDVLFSVEHPGRAVPEEVRLAHAEVQRNLEKVAALRNADNLTVRTPEAIEQAGREIDELFRKDELFRLALEEQAPWLYANKRFNFGAPGARLEGMARWREQVRQRKAVRTAAQKASHRQGLKAFGDGGWVRETYSRGGNTVSMWKYLPTPIKGTAAVVSDALTRPLTYAAMESPSGWVSLTRGAYTQNEREVTAILDNLKMYADPSEWASGVLRREAALTEGRQTVGTRALTGIERKQEILTRFIRNAHLDPERAVRVLERDIVMDMARYYQPGRSGDLSGWYDDIGQMFRHLDAQRAELIRNVQDKGYWVDEARNKHVSPFLESQLAQGMPMADFRRMESLVERYSKKGRQFGGFGEFSEAVNRVRQSLNKASDELAAATKGTPEYKASERNVKQLEADLKLALQAEMRARGGGSRFWEGSLRWYDEFQILWRAGVLFRLGYPTRNAIDGVVRRITYEASIVPVIQDAMRGSRNLASNVKAGRVRDDLPFEWMNKAARSRKDRLAGSARASVESGQGLPRKVERWRNREIERVDSYRTNLAQRRDALQDVIDDLKTSDRGHLSDDSKQALDAEVMGLVDHYRAIEADIERLDRQLATLTDPGDAVLAYRQSLDQPRRIGDEFVFGVDGSMYYGMTADPRYRGIMLDEVSARETQQASLGMSLDIARSVNRAVNIRSGGVVGPGAVNYYDALAYVINNHIRNSAPGNFWIDNLNVSEAATRLMRREGKRYRETVGKEAAQRQAQRGATEADMAAARAILDASDQELETVMRQFLGTGEPSVWRMAEALPTELVDEIRNLRKQYRTIRGKSANKAAQREAVSDEIRALEKQLGLRLRDPRIASLDARIAQAERELMDISGPDRSIRFLTPEGGEVFSSPYMAMNAQRERMAAKYKEINDLRVERSRVTEERPFQMPEGDRIAYWMQSQGIESIDDAREAMEFVFREFDRIIPNPAVRDAMARGPVTADFLRKNMRAEDWDLVPVHGAEIELLAGGGQTLSFVEKINPGIGKVYSLIGSMPEDTLIRVPFASQVYRDNIRVGSAWLSTAFPDGQVPAWAVESMERQARQRAVRETKTYLYTQDRRTNFGRVMERYVPFVSAWQNSVMAFSRMLKMNPEMLYFYEQAWRAPDHLGMVDQDGNIRIPMSAAFAPLGSWMGGDELVFRKQSLFVMPDQFDPLLTFKAGPVQQVAASTLMQMNVIGPIIPAPVKTILKSTGLDDAQAQQVWDMGARLTFGTDPDTGRPMPPSTLPLSIDKALPPVMQKGVQWVQSKFGNTPENNVLYATQYSRILREEVLRYAQGEREDLPTRDEVKDKTNALYFTRMMNNFLGFTAGPLGMVTPPTLDSNAYALQETYRLLSDTVGYEQADSVWTSMFGDEALYLTNFRGTASPGGMPVSVDAMERAEKYNSLIAALAGGMDEANLSMLGYLLGDGSYVNEDYAPDIRAIQLLRNIPGTNKSWREVLTPDEQTREASISTGWSMYTQTMDAIYAEMNARGLKSLNSAGAAPLRKLRDDFLERMRTDPLYTQWHDDYQNGGERRLGGSLDFLRSAIGNDEFMAGPGANEEDMWQTAQLWLSERQKYYAALRGIREMDGYEGNDYASASLRDAWTDRSTQIAETNWRFRQFWVRYLDNDDLTMD